MTKSQKIVERKIDELLNLEINSNPGSVARVVAQIASILTELNGRCPPSAPTPLLLDRASDHNH